MEQIWAPGIIAYMFLNLAVFMFSQAVQRQSKVKKRETLPRLRDFLRAARLAGKNQYIDVMIGVKGFGSKTLREVGQDSALPDAQLIRGEGGNRRYGAGKGGGIDGIVARSFT
ncbi:hypothetical protein DFH07DRAFT_813364 [Mycena maculata]|uniref:Uncharacterized protein n=1 Tax=Mycena maculata TaxID=230809 RepID=A0AAD7JG80_9AGAR|nr:hypothetical protein DFH07DRAFT_813364 [Mycena maculata]